MWQVSTAAQECWRPSTPGRPLEQRCLPARWQEAGHERSAGVGAQGDRPPPEHRAPWEGTRQPPSPVCVSPGGPQPGTASHSATIPTHSAHSLPPKPALHRNTAAEGRSRHDAHLSCPSAASPGPQPRPRIRPESDCGCQPPAWSQAGTSPWGTPPPPTAGPGRETEAWRCVTFPQHSLGWGPCPTGSARRLTAEIPDKRPQMLCGPRMGRPVQLLPGSTGLAEGLLLNSCVRLGPSNTPSPHPEGQGLGAPHAVLSRGLGHPPVPAAAHPAPAPLPAGREQAHEAAQLRRRPSGTAGRGKSAGGSRACAPKCVGLPRPCPPVPRPPAGAESMPKEAGPQGPTRRWTRLRGNSEQEAAASGLLPRPAPPRGYSGLVACGPGQNCSSGGTIGRDHWVPMATPPTRHRLRPHLPAPLPSRRLPTALESPGAPRPSLPPERPHSWPSSLPSPLRTAHGQT